MSTLLSVIGSAALLMGAFFLLAAGIGLQRFLDPLMRMHASTKAGTLGAGFTLLGVMLIRAETATTLIGVLTVLFLLLTVPIAGHLLGRAIYVSGAKLSLGKERDALHGVLPRRDAPLEERAAAPADGDPA